MKKQLILFVLLALASFPLSAQNHYAVATAVPLDDQVSLQKNTSKVATAEAIAFLRKEQLNMQTILKAMTYPQLAQENGVEGTVLLELTYDCGITAVKVRESLGYGCDEAALEAVERYAQLHQPEKSQGNKTPVKVLVPFKFSLQ
ncbi:MAG: energy transducer TonB [Bacteroidota bacterium]